MATILADKPPSTMEQVFKTAGLKTWVDSRELEAGDRLRTKIADEIKALDYFVPILSPLYMSSPWCLREFELAVEAEVPVVPMKITEGRLVPPPDLKNLFEKQEGLKAFPNAA